MNDATGAIAAVAGALATLVVAALFVPGVARVFLIAQAAYWSLSYLARPVVLLWTLPVPQFADSIADPRLANVGYDHGIAQALGPVVFGMWFYTLLVVGFAMWCHRSRSTRWQRKPSAGTDPNFFPTLWVVYALGTLGRLASVATGSTGSAGDVQSSNPILDFVTTMATVGALGLIVYARPESRGITVLLISAAIAGEFLWTVAVESKTPILGAALALAIRFALTGWTRATVGGIAVVGVGAIGAFGLLQSLKTSDATKAIADFADASYPASVQPFLSILRRFDLLEAATDAWYMGGRPWISASRVIENSILNFVPAQLLGTEKFQSGTAWASQVRGASVDMTGISVSLAEGNVNEGFVLGGYFGIVCSMSFTFLLLLSAQRWILAKNIVPVVMGLTLVEFPVLFERGILGSTESLGKSLQAAVLIWIVYLAVGEFRRRTAGSSADQNVSIETRQPTVVDGVISKGSKTWA